MSSPCDTAGPRPARRRGRSDPGRAWRGHGARRVSREGGGEAEGTTGDERRPRNAGTLGVREEPARVQEEEPRRGAGGGTLPGCGRRNPPGCGRRNPLGCGRRDPAGSDGYGLGEGPAGTQDVVRAPVTVAQVPSLGQRPRHRHLQRGHVNTRHPPTHTHTLQGTRRDQHR